MLRQNGGEQMLAGMLLHMVKASIPIDLPPGTLAGQGRREQVCNPLAFVHHIGDFDSPQLADIERLADTIVIVHDRSRIISASHRRTFA